VGLQHEVDGVPRRFERGSSASAKTGAKPAATRSTLRSRRTSIVRRASHHFARRRGAARLHTGGARIFRYRPIERPDEALPPFAQVIADMDGLVVRSRREACGSWWKTYHANFIHSITSEVKNSGVRGCA
jgi:hypothetical protein